MREYEKTYTDGDGVVPSKVIPDVVILELLHCFASARTQWPCSEETEEQRRERTHKRLDVRQISMHVRRASTISFASSSKYVACPSRSGSQLSSSNVSAVELPLVCSVPRIPLNSCLGRETSAPGRRMTHAPPRCATSRRAPPRARCGKARRKETCRPPAVSHRIDLCPAAR